MHGMRKFLMLVPWLCLALELVAGVTAPSLSAANQPASSSSAMDQTTARVAAFQFGTPDSATRAGFTKITIKDAYTAEKGYGFESTQGLVGPATSQEKTNSPDVLVQFSVPATATVYLPNSAGRIKLVSLPLIGFPFRYHWYVVPDEEVSVFPF
jgi:hypothetical protein